MCWQFHCVALNFVNILLYKEMLMIQFSSECPVTWYQSQFWFIVCIWQMWRRFWFPFFKTWKHVCGRSRLCESGLFSCWQMAYLTPLLNHLFCISRIWLICHQIFPSGACELLSHGLLCAVASLWGCFPMDQISHGCTGKGLNCSATVFEFCHWVYSWVRSEPGFWRSSSV